MTIPTLTSEQAEEILISLAQRENFCSKKKSYALAQQVRDLGLLLSQVFEKKYNADPGWYLRIVQSGRVPKPDRTLYIPT